MFRKLFIMWSVLLGLVFFEIAGECFADALAELEQAETDMKNKDFESSEALCQGVITDYPDTDYALEAQRKLVVLNIAKDKQPETEAAFQELVTNFAGNDQLTKAVHDIAKQCLGLEAYQKASEIYQYLLDNWPQGYYAMRSHTGMAIAHISLHNQEAAQISINELLAKFSESEYMVEDLYYIAEQYYWFREYDKAIPLYQYILDNWPQNEYAMWSQSGLVTANICSGNYAQAQNALGKLTTDFNGHSDLPEALSRIAWRYGLYGKNQEARTVYQQIIQEHTGSLYADKARLDVQKSEVFTHIDTGDDSSASAAIDKLVVDFSGHSYLPDVVTQFAERYCDKASRAENEGSVNQAQDYRQKAAAICEIVMNALPDSAETPKACYYAADSYRRLGEYEKSIECCQRVVSDYPSFSVASSALLLMGRNYEKLKQSGAISKAQADIKTRSAYEQILEKHPISKAANYARNWLSRQVDAN